MTGEIEYAIVALCLTPEETAEIVKDATGMTVDANAADFLESLDLPQLQATWEKLSENPRWRTARK